MNETPNTPRKAIQLIAEFGADLLMCILSCDGVEAWNDLVDDLMERNLLPPCWEAGSKPEPVGLLLDLSNLKLPHHQLDNIDLSMCWLANANFTGASLRNAKMGCGRNVSYRMARIDGADFRGIEISGCDFSGCSGTAMFDGAVFDPANPPIGLPAEVMAVCKPEAAPPPTNVREPRNPQARGFEQAPIKCFASIHFVPIGE